MKTMAIVALLLFAAPGAWADDDGRERNKPRDRMSLYSGMSQTAFGLEGILLNCETEVPDLPTRVLVRAVYTKLAGVCDDLSDRPCAGRLTRLTERCFFDVMPTFISANALTTYFKEKVRICYDATAAGNCDDVDVVAKGEFISQSTNGFFNGLIDENFTTFDETQVGYDREIIKRSRRFEIDGKYVRVPRGRSYGQSARRFDEECLAVNNCPQTGTLLRE